jgi:hypothetical protein
MQIKSTKVLNQPLINEYYAKNNTTDLFAGF